MANILSEKSKQGVQKEYRLRFAVMALVLVSLLIIILALLLVPAFLLLSIQETSLTDQVDAVSASEEETQTQSAQVLDTTNIMMELKQSQLMLTDTLEEVTDSAPSGVSLTGLSLRRDTINSDSGEESPEVSNSVSVAVSGLAQTRAQLLEFRDSLVRSSMFTGINLPVSQLAQDRNVEFNLTVNASAP